MDKKSRLVIFRDNQGKAIGVGEETKVTTPVPEVIGAKTVQTLLAINSGSSSKDREEIDKQTFDEIKDPSKKRSLKDFDVVKG